MKSILHVVGALNYGGAETSLLGQVKRSQDYGVTSIVFSASGSYGDLEKSYRDAGAVLYSSALKRRPLKTVIFFIWLCRSTKPNVVVSHLGLPTGLFLLLAKFAKVPRRVSVLHSEGDCKRIGRLKAVQNELLRMLLVFSSSVNIGVSGPALEYGDSRWASLRVKVRLVISNGVDTDRFRPSRNLELKKQVIYVGRSSAVKNRRRLAGISRCLVQRGWNRIVVVGPIGDDVRTDDSSLVLMGVRADVPELLRNSDVLILVSEEEGEGIVILEALASGIPVVSTPTGGAVSIASKTLGVDLVSLDESDDIWAERLVDAARGYGGHHRSLVAQGVSANGYALSGVIAQWYSAYLGTRK